MLFVKLLSQKGNLRNYTDGKEFMLGLIKIKLAFNHKSYTVQKTNLQTKW